jgi:hypothetical protein
MIYEIIHLTAEGVGVRATARILGVAKATVNQAILKVGDHCQSVLTGLMKSLQLTEAQMDELWAFVKKKRLLSKMSVKRDGKKSGSGQP